MTGLETASIAPPVVEESPESLGHLRVVAAAAQNHEDPDNHDSEQYA